MHEATLNSRHVYSGRVLLDVRVEEVRLDDGATATRELVEVAEAVLLLPILDDGRLVLIRQYRKGIEAALLELPAGKLDPGEEREAAARRELAEETGSRCARLEYLGPIHTSPGFCNETIHLYRARGLEHVGQHTDADERIDVLTPTPTEVEQLLDEGALTDAKTLCALLLHGRR